MHDKKRSAVLLIIVSGLLLAFSVPTLAQSTNDRLVRLEAMVAQLEDALKDARSEITEMKNTLTQEKDYELQGTGGGLKIETKDGSSFQFGGSIQVDYNLYNDVFKAREGPNNAHAGSSDSEGEFRRIRLYSKGSIKKDWKYKLAIDIDDDNSEASIDSAYIRYEGFRPFAITVGQFKEPYSLERLASSKWISTMERNMIVNALGGVLGAGQPEYAGVGISGYHKDMSHLNWSIGVFDDGAEEPGGKDSFAYTGRITVAPMIDEHLIHLGLAYSMRDLEGAAYKLQTRMGVHTAQKFNLGESASVGDVDQLGLEVAYQYQAFSMQGEYYDVGLDGVADGTNTAQENDLDMDGYYVQAAYTLTGEPRKYKAQGAIFDRIRPQGKYGAWELVARYETMSVEEDSSGDDVEADKYTLGVNWYFNDNVKFMANYISADVSNDANRQSVVEQIVVRGGNDDGDAFTMRMQYAW